MLYSKIKAAVKTMSFRTVVIVSLIVGAVLIAGAALLAILTDDYSVAAVFIDIGNKAVNLGLLFGGLIIYKVFFKNKDFDTDEEISRNPIAVAIDSGAMALAIAVAVVF